MKLTVAPFDAGLILTALWLGLPGLPAAEA